MAEKSRFFTCYFCNRKIEDDTELGHTSVCGNVLVPCPNKCGSYVPRLDLMRHKSECINRVVKSSTLLKNSTEHLHTIGKNGSSYEAASDKGQSNGQKRDVQNLFSVIQDDIRSLSNKLSNIEQQSSTSSSYSNLNSKNHESIQSEIYGTYKGQQKHQFETLKYNIQLLNEWRKIVDLQLDSLKQSLNVCEKARSENMVHWMTLQQKVISLEKIQMDVGALRESIFNEQNYSRQADLELARKIDELKDFVEHENAVIAALWNEQKNGLEELRVDVENIKAHVEDSKAKHAGLIFNLKTVNQISSEASEKVEIQEREFRQLKDQVEQLRLDMEILESLASGDKSFGVPGITSGQIVFKISDFDSKLSKAQDNNAVVKSEIFYTHQFGYRIRVLVFLNGLNKWRDRYTLISLHVLKGEYDPLLKWPCHIEGTVTLRDLENIENPKNFSKFITAKRQSGDEDNEEPQESSSSYIFIPHSTLLSSRYLKDDSIFLDIKIEQSRKLLNETSV